MVAGIAVRNKEASTDSIEAHDANRALSTMARRPAGRPSPAPSTSPTPFPPLCPDPETEPRLTQEPLGTGTHVIAALRE